MQSLKSPYILYNQQSVGSTLHNNLLFITNAALLVCHRNHFCFRHNRFLLYIDLAACDAFGQDRRLCTGMKKGRLLFSE